MGASTELDLLSGKRQTSFSLTVGGSMSRMTSSTWLDDGSAPPLSANDTAVECNSKALRWFAKGGLGFQDYATTVLGDVDVTSVLRDRGTANFHRKYPDYGRPGGWLSLKRHPW